MTRGAITKPGFSVLAYVSLQVPSSVSLSLKFRYNDEGTQATLCLLQSSIIQRDSEDGDTFVILQYDPENLVPGSISLKPMAYHPGLSTITRSPKPQIHMLSLKLKRCCPVWLPLTGLIASKPGYEDQFQHFETLARATDLHIVFDYAWLPTPCLATFHRLVDHPDQLSAYSVDRYYTQHCRREDAYTGSHFAPTDAILGRNNTTEDEEQPPPYSKPGSSKRHASNSAPLSPRTRKRKIRTPLNAKDIVTSEEGRDGAGTIASDIQQAVRDVLPQILPGLLETILPGLVQSAVSKHLPSALEVTLPHLLSAPLSPSPSPSQSASCQTSPVLVPKVLSALGEVLTRRVVLGLKQELEGVHDQTLSHAENSRCIADAEFQEELRDLRLELFQAKEDLVVDLNRIGDDTLNEFKQKCEAEEEEAGNRLLQKRLAEYDRFSDNGDTLIEGGGDLDTRKRILFQQKDALLKRQLRNLNSERMLLAQETALFELENSRRE